MATWYAQQSATSFFAAWWATDTETLYRWTGSEWVAYYTPYTYPHPFTV